MKNLKITTMKKMFFTILAIMLAMDGFAADYEETMAANIQKLNSVITLAEFTSLANQFERIANVEKTKWHPAYYAAFCYVSALTRVEMTADEKQKLLDLAQLQIDDLMKSFKSESEIYALQAFVYQMRITDMSKGFKYSSLASESIDEAEKLNPNNPRAYYLRGTNTFHTPKAFGGGKEKAKPLFEKAAALFKNQKPANAIEPAWGSQHNSQMLAQCNSDEK